MPARSRAFTRASSTETGAAERAPAADSRPAGGIQSEAGGSGSLPPAEAATRRAAEAVSPFFYTRSRRGTENELRAAVAEELRAPARVARRGTSESSWRGWEMRRRVLEKS